MGSSESKQAKDEEEEEEGRVYEPYLIQWDQHGHLRYGEHDHSFSAKIRSDCKTIVMFGVKFIGEAHKVDPGRQMVEIMELDYVDDIVSTQTWSCLL